VFLSHLTSSDGISTDLVSFELAVIGRSSGDWVASQCTTKFAVAATSHSELG